MSTIVTSKPASPVSVARQSAAGPWREIVDFFQQFIVAAFHPYRPEQHYMRGPGPACQAKREPLAHRHLI
ncbi:MAG: hypothetical protein M9932_09910 [Xanthobacteraceae bacterium]|nr:hypothetical protein [Xanthobacteraceae bacterium]